MFGKTSLVLSSSGGSAMIPDDNRVEKSEPELQRSSRAGTDDSKKAWTVRVNSSEESWILDFGASFHLCSEAGMMEGYTARSFGKVYLGDGTTLEVAGKGSARIKGENGSVLQVRDVRHVPGLRKNLLSVGQLDRDGYKMTFSCENWKIVKGARVVARGRKNGTLYVMGTVQRGIKGAQGSDAGTWRRGGSNHGNQKQKRVSFVIKELKSGVTSTGLGTYGEGQAGRHYQRS